MNAIPVHLLVTAGMKPRRCAGNFVDVWMWRIADLDTSTCECLLLGQSGRRASALEQDEDSASVAFTDGRRATYDLVVGADGGNSTVRDVVFGTGYKPKYTGQAVWRATVRRPAEVDGRYSFFGPRNKAGFNPVSATEMYVCLVQNLPEFTRIPDGRLPAVMREQLADFGGLLAAARDEITDHRSIVCRPVTSGILPAPWYRGRVVLIGDAAHTTTPHMAAGAGLAIEDSVVLARLLGSPQALPEVLDAFMKRRQARCRMVVENSFQLGEWEKNPGAPEASKDSEERKAAALSKRQCEPVGAWAFAAATRIS